MKHRLLFPATALIGAAVQFIVLTAIAMLVYPGGAKFHSATDHYLFFGNFFSDLGATRTITGHSNTTSHVLFLIALGLTGLSLAYFSAVWRIESNGRVAGTVSQVAALISGLGFVGIAATPWNLVYDAHNLFVRIAFGLLLVYVICMVLVQAQIAWPRAFFWLNVAYLVLLLAYVVNLFAGPGLDTPDGLRFQVAAQKVMVYASIINLGIQAAGVRAAVRRRAL
ncbi:MAG TPA: hypothetical protein VHC49_21990 [Mycobacteriales bacterium]|nr:hypothetical protein [Mycobacteriales bacterium]